MTIRQSMTPWCTGDTTSTSITRALRRRSGGTSRNIPAMGIQSGSSSSCTGFPIPMRYLNWLAGWAIFWTALSWVSCQVGSDGAQPALSWQRYVARCWLGATE